MIVLLFATDRGDALARIGSHWLPELRRIGVRAPVILVGTKSDTKSADHNLQQVTSVHRRGAAAASRPAAAREPLACSG